MTDKEQIIIDGVDVAECEFYENGNCNCVDARNCERYIFDEVTPCIGNPECNFKQLARKTQLIDEIEEVIKPYQEQIELDALSLPSAIKSIIERKMQECEELKERLKTQIDLPIRYVPEKVLNRYRKALEEIEKICNLEIAVTGDLPFRTITSDILDIINNAKGEK